MDKIVEKFLWWKRLRTNFLGLISRCEKGDVELFAVTSQRIWHRKNEIVHGGTLTHPNQIVREAEVSLEDFQRVNRNTGQQDRVASSVTVEKVGSHLRRTW